jgi:hypothetical protein
MLAAAAFFGDVRPCVCVRARARVKGGEGVKRGTAVGSGSAGVPAQEKKGCVCVWGEGGGGRDVPSLVTLMPLLVLPVWCPVGHLHQA